MFDLWNFAIVKCNKPKLRVEARVSVLGMNSPPSFFRKTGQMEETEDAGRRLRRDQTMQIFIYIFCIYNKCISHFASVVFANLNVQ